MQSWTMPSFNDTVSEIRRYTHLDTRELLTDDVVNQSDAVISHTDEVGAKSMMQA